MLSLTKRCLWRGGLFALLTWGAGLLPVALRAEEPTPDAAQAVAVADPAAALDTRLAAIEQGLTDRKVVADAQIMIKVLGSSFRPVIFHANTDSNGVARVHLQLPHFTSGRAALLLRASHSGEEIELRRIVTPG